MKKIIFILAFVVGIVLCNAQESGYYKMIGTKPGDDFYAYVDIKNHTTFTFANEEYFKCKLIGEYKDYTLWSVYDQGIFLKIYIFDGYFATSIEGQGLQGIWKYVGKDVPIGLVDTRNTVLKAASRSE